MIELNLKQIKLISHSLGIDIFNAVISNKRKDKILPTIFYRNYFNASKTSFYHDLIMELIELGIMDKFRDEYYCVTDNGIDIFKYNYEKLVKYIPQNNMDLNYLKHKINFYCNFYNYKFCDDNSIHIFEEYVNKYANKIYVSHTTKDVILKFKQELKKYNKHRLLDSYFNPNLL